MAGTSIAISSALSGLAAATQRINGVARNVANARRHVATRPRKPAIHRVPAGRDGAELGRRRRHGRQLPPVLARLGGVLVIRIRPSPMQNGLVATPNVDLTSQAVALIAATEAYKANLKVLQVATSLQDSLLKVFA